ncbi:DUF4190 domain-containing protein [Aquiluna sp. KACHI24]|uniref:DUF4190 domain-containing protein n=1 Tax=Aquiluna sp. KACHI24 TaxID=2968831 RepID=UPI00220D87D2|nr:DUF4190 domain-containing protein [Aquiluna sp. KACHI24]BDP99865.1 hypothetical protein AKACHI_02020 [Aquiluna sp. KACHI24]
MADKKESEPVAQEPEVSTPQQKEKFDFTRLNTLAVVSLAAAISGVGALIAVITGHVSLAQLKRSGESGRGLAIAGLVVGYLHIAFWIIFVALGVISKALIYSGVLGLQPGGPEFFEFQRGFDGMHMWRDR